MAENILDNPEFLLLEILRSLGISYTRIAHPPVFTCAEARSFRPGTPGLETKNLFLRDERHRFYLVLTDCSKRLDLKALGQQIGAPKLQFGNEEQLRDCLGLTPGSVTVFGLINDLHHQVELLVDDEFWPAEVYLCHPMVNTTTLVLDHASLERFLEHTAHPPKLIRMPGLQ